MTSTTDLFSDLGKRLGVPLSNRDGASVITLDTGKELWVEGSDNSELIVMHTQAGELSANDLYPNQLQQFLELNTQPDTLKGAWIGIHQGTNTVRFCVAAPVNFVDAEVLEVLANGLMDLAESTVEALVN